MSQLQRIVKALVPFFGVGIDDIMNDTFQEDESKEALKTATEMLAKLIGPERAKRVLAGLEAR